MYWSRDLGSYEEQFEAEFNTIKKKKTPGVDKFDVLTNIESRVATDVYERFADMETGLIKGKDIKTMFTLLGQNPTEPEVYFMIADLKKKPRRKVTQESDYYYTFDDFLYLARNYAKTKSEMRSEYEEAFKLFDQENTGYVYSTDILKLLEIVVGGEIEEDIKNLMLSFEDKKDGKIYYKDFITKAIEENIFSDERF